MQRIKTSTATAEKPAYSTAGTPGYFRVGNAVADIPATVMGQDWPNMIQEEIAHVITAAGLTLSAEDDTQLAKAIAALIAAQAVTVEAASETVAGILKLATAAMAKAGTDDSAAMTALKVAAAVAGAVRAYTAQQYASPVVRTGQSGSQAVDCDAHQLLSITATGALAFAAPTNTVVGKTVTIMIYSAASVALTWDAAYVGQSGYALPGATTAGKWLVLSFLCHKAGALLLTGVAEEA
jgi:hypothetical protein